MSQPAASGLERAEQAALGERHRMQAAGEVPQLGMRLAQLVVGEAQDVRGLVVVPELALGDLEQVPDSQQALLRAVVQVAADPPALRIGGFDDPRARVPQCSLLMATLELGRGPRREDAHRGDVIVSCLHGSRVHHGHMAQVGAVGGAQADREVALETHVDRRLGLGEARGQRVRERDDRLVHDERAGLAVRVVLERLVHPVAVVPAADHPYVLARGVRGLGDEGELRVERQRDVTDQPANELVTDRTSGSLGHCAKQIAVADSRATRVDVGRRRHEPPTRLPW